MRTWKFGVCLAAVTASVVYTVLSGSLHSAGCRPCAAVAAEPEPPPAPEPVVHVVDVHALLAPPAEPTKQRFVSFDEPPLANPPTRPAPEVIPAAFVELVAVEVAPAPRRVISSGPLPLATPNDEF